MNGGHAEPFTCVNNKHRLRNMPGVVQGRHSQETPARRAGGSEPLKQGSHCSTVRATGTGEGGVDKEQHRTPHHGEERAAWKNERKGEEKPTGGQSLKHKQEVTPLPRPCPRHTEGWTSNDLKGGRAR